MEEKQQEDNSSEFYYEEEDVGYDDYEFSEYDDDYLGGGYIGSGGGKKIRGDTNKRKGNEKAGLNVYSSRHTRLVGKRRGRLKVKMLNRGGRD